MRKNIALYVLTPLMVSIVTVVAGAGKYGRPIEMFGQSMMAENQAVWKAVIEDPQTDANAIWKLRDGMLVLKGGPRGYLRTEQEFTNFVLKLEWRRPPGKKPGRGGVLIRMTGKDKIWPKSLEAQLNAGDAGDFWGLDGYQLTGPPQRFKRLQNDRFGTLRNLKKTEDAEKPAGEWNQYEIVADGQTVTLKINGRVINRATGCDVVAGNVCLTAEGDEIHFRNVRLTPMLN